MYDQTSDFLEEDQQGKDEPGASLSGTKNTGGASTPATVTPTVTPVGAPSASAAPVGTSSGSFSNIQKYIDANKGFNADGGGVAGKIASNIESQAQSTKSNIQDASNAFEAQAKGNADTWGNAGATVSNALADPSKASEADIAKIAAARDAKYTGKSSLNELEGDKNLGKLATNAATVADNAQQATSEAGRFNLLKQMFGTPTYSRGQQNLDNTLMQSDQAQLRRLQGTKQAARDINASLQTAEESAQQKAKDLGAQAETVKATTRSQLNNAVVDQDAALQAKALQAADQHSKEVEKAKSLLATGQLSQEDFNKIASNVSGFTSGMRTYGVDLSKFLNDTGNINKETIASADDYARFQALSKMLGGSDAVNEGASAALAAYADPTKAGRVGGYDINGAALKAAIDKAKTVHTQQVQSTFDQLLQSDPGFQTVLNAASRMRDRTSGPLGSKNPIRTGEELSEFLRTPTGKRWAESQVSAYGGKGQLGTPEFMNAQAANMAPRLAPFLNLNKMLEPTVRKIGANEVTNVEQPIVDDIGTGPGYGRPKGVVEVK